MEKIEIINARFKVYLFDLNSKIWICVTDVFEQSVVLFAHERFAVVAGNVMPVNAVIVEVVQNSQTVLVGSTLLQFTVVRLWFANAAIC